MKLKIFLIIIQIIIAVLFFITLTLFYVVSYIGFPGNKL